MTEVVRHMCIRVLRDDDVEVPTHFRVVDANDYDDLLKELHALKYPPLPCKHSMCEGSIASDGTGHSRCMHCGVMLYDTRKQPRQAGGEQT